MPRSLPTALLLLTACAGEPADAPALDIRDVGLATPESVLHDPATDRYLISNINGGPLDPDGNGFISRFRPDGTVDVLKWIDGAAAGVTLNAPKGMALLGDTLFVADINVVRLFHRESGAPLGLRAVPGATFLNDVVVSGSDVYVTDSGLDAAFAPTGRDAVWRVTTAEPRAIAQGPALGTPNGLAATPQGLVVVSFGESGVYRVLPGSGLIDELPSPPTGGLDGVVILPDGAMLVSSWHASVVYRIGSDGAVGVAVDSIPSPADIGWDADRRRVLIPVFQEDRVVVRRLD